jgi:hypothetical protein
MSQEKLQQAATLLRAGDRKHAGELLMGVVQADPGNVDAWYGLAICTEETEKKRLFLNKVLEINPQHTKASQLLEKIDSGKYVVQPAVTVKAGSSIIKAVTPSVVGILLLCVIWLFYKVDRLEKSLTTTQRELVATQTKLTNVQLDLSTTIDTLSYVQALAENADQYAHSHNNFSDIRLKTNISPISGPLNSILYLDGVTFFWNTKKYPELGLSDDPQIGFIAQEVEKIYPELVTTDESGFKTVDYNKLIPVLVEGIKQQQVIIHELELRVDTLEQQNR